jgi:hypothetical protein
MTVYGSGVSKRHIKSSTSKYGKFKSSAVLRPRVVFPLAAGPVIIIPVGFADII